MEAREIKMGQQMLAGSNITGVGGGVLDPSAPQPGTEPGRAPLFDDPEWDVLLGE